MSDDKRTYDIDSGDTSWVLVSTAMVMLMTVGVSLFYGGSVGHKNIISTMYQCSVTLSSVTIVWVLVGFSLSYGDSLNGFVGSPATYIGLNGVGAEPNDKFAVGVPFAAFAIFELMFASMAPIVINGAMSERVDFYSWIIFTPMWTLVVYCPIAHMVWHPNGLLRTYGYLDFAGGIPIELTAGLGSLAASMYIGPPTVKNESPANIPNVILGTAITAFGWYGFNGGSALSSDGEAAIVFLNTSVAGATGMITWIFTEFLTRSPAKSAGGCNGLFIGLAVITPCCAYFTCLESLILGSLTTVLCFFLSRNTQRYFNIDNVSSDIIVIHGIGGGTVGVLATSFACTYQGDVCATLHTQVLAWVISAPYIFGMTWLVCMVTNWINPLRISLEAEHLGLDISFHNESLHFGVISSEMDCAPWIEMPDYGSTSDNASSQSIVHRRVSLDAKTLTKFSPTLVNKNDYAISECSEMTTEMDNPDEVLQGRRPSYLRNSASIPREMLRWAQHLVQDPEVKADSSALEGSDDNGCPVQQRSAIQSLFASVDQPEMDHVGSSE